MSFQVTAAKRAAVAQRKPDTGARFRGQCAVIRMDRPKPTGPPSSGDSEKAASLDVPTAAVWAYVHGYLCILLRGPPLSQRLGQLASEQLPSFPQLLLLCPLNGQLPDSVDQLDERLTSVGSAEPFSASVAGARSRSYGAHPAYQLASDSGAHLVAVEPVASLRTLRVVAAEMARCERSMPRLDERQLICQFVTVLHDVVSRDAQLRDLVRLVVYDPSQSGEPVAALTRAVFEEAEVEAPQPVPASAPLPGGVGVYLAWSFFHGYLLLVAGRRDVAGELAALERDSALPLPLKRIAVLCPATPGWTEAAGATAADDVTSLDAQLEPVRDVAGVGVGVPALAGRTYGSFSIYRICGDGSCFALEVATPLRTLSLGIASEGLGPEVYRREASIFTEELQTLLKEHPTVAAQFVAVSVQEDTQIHSELAKLAPREDLFRQQQETIPEAAAETGTRRRLCTLI